MSRKVFIEKHLESYLKDLVENNKQQYIPGVIIGQVIGNNYYVVHLAAVSSTGYEDSKSNKKHVLAYNNHDDILADSEMLFKQLLQVVNLLPGGSHVLGLFFIVPQDVKSFQPMNIDFKEFHTLLKERLLYSGNIIFNENDKTWDYLLLNYSPINKKSFCYTVNFNRSNGPKVTNFKPVDHFFESLDDDWVTLVGTFNFGSLGWFNVASGPKALLSIREDLFGQFESILSGAVFTFNGCVCDENKILKDFECHTIDEVLKHVVNVELYREVDLGNEYKNASLKVKRGKERVMMSGLCSIAVPFNRNGSVKDAIKAIYEDAMNTFAIRLKMHLESMVEEQSIEEGSETNVVHETPRRILILKTEGSKFAFSDYVFPGGTPQEALIVAGELLNLSEEKIELYDVLEKGRQSYYEELPDIDSSPPLDAITVTYTNNNRLIYFVGVSLILALLAYVIKQIFV